MRLAFFALVLSVVVWSCPIGAQSRGASGSVSTSSSVSAGGSVSAGATRGFSGTNSSVVSSSGTNSTSTNTPGRKTFLGIPVGLENRNPNRNFGRDFGNHHRRSPFGSPFGFPFGYGFGYAVDYSGWYNDQNQLQEQENMAQSERLQQSYQDDQKRQRELERQLADQRAADAAEANARYAPTAATPTSPDRDLPPTVLVYKDHHQVEILNYAVTGSMIYEFNPHWTRKIPLSELDIQATIAANNERGIEFKVPNSSPVKVNRQQQQQ